MGEVKMMPEGSMAYGACFCLAQGLPSQSQTPQIQRADAEN